MLKHTHSNYSWGITQMARNFKVPIFSIYFIFFFILKERFCYSLCIFISKLPLIWNKKFNKWKTINNTGNDILCSFISSLKFLSNIHNYFKNFIIKTTFRIRKVERLRMESRVYVFFGRMPSRHFINVTLYKFLFLPSKIISLSS